MDEKKFIRKRQKMKEAPKSCLDLHPNCPYLYIPQNGQVNPDRIKIIICTALNVPLDFEKERIDWIKNTISSVHPVWECPFWVQGRKDGKYEPIQKSIP